MKKQKMTRSKKVLLGISCFAMLMSLISIFLSLDLDTTIKNDLPLFKYKSHLMEDDIDVYTENAVVYDVNDFPKDTIDYSSNEHAKRVFEGRTLTERYFDFVEQEKKVELQTYETKHGIQIGSTVDDIVEAYSGMECMIIDSAGTQDFLPIKRLGKAWYLNRLGDSYTIRITATYRHGNWDSDYEDEFIERRNYAETPYPMSVYDYEDYPWFVNSVYLFSIEFKIDKSNVENIIIRHWDS